MSLPGFSANESLGKNIGQYGNLSAGIQFGNLVKLAGLPPSSGQRFGFTAPGVGPVGLTGICHCGVISDICLCYPPWADDFIILPAPWP